MIPEGYKTNFNTMLLAAKNGHLALMECYDKATGKPVMTVCAVSRVGGEFECAPIAKLFDGNPYEELDPPLPGDGRNV
jgi:hypothetical protein